MNPDVLLQVSWLSKRCLAVAALKRFLTCMNPYMPDEVAVVREHRVAKLAGVAFEPLGWFLPAVVEQVRLQILGSGKGGPTLLTRKRFDPRVHPAMLGKLTGRRECCTALIAQIWLEAQVPAGVILQRPRVGE